MEQASDFEFGGENIQPGSRVTVELPMARLYTNSSMTLPVQVVHGAKSGPVLFVSAAIHGDEINGVEIVRRLLSCRALSHLRGTLLAVPVANPFGFIQRSRYLPDRRDLNRSFPGTAKGSSAGRLAHLFMKKIISRSDYGIDLHTGSNYRSNLPQIRASLNDPETIELASVFGASIVVPSELREGSLREVVADLGKPVLVYEGGEALTFNESAICIGLEGVLNVMRHVGMLPNRKKGELPKPIIADRTSWVRASMSGTFALKVQLGDLVKQGDLLGILNDPFGSAREKVYAPFTGVNIGQLNLPLVHEGDALIHLAKVPDMDGAKEDLNGSTSSLTLDDFGLV
jgi:predicted deacylase